MNMFSMFYGATDFSQDLSGWNVNNLQTMIDFNRESGLGDAQLPNFDDVDLPPIITSKETPLYSGKEIRETTLHFTVGDVDGVAYNGTEGDADNFIDDLKVELFIGTGDFLGVTPTLLMARHSQRTMIDIDLPAGTYIRGNVLRITFPAGLFIDTPAVETGKTKKTSAETAFEFVVQ